MSPETFTSQVRRYCEWVESSTHDLETAHQVMLALLEGAPGLKASEEQEVQRGFPGLRDEVRAADYKRFADLPFQCYPVVFWPREVDTEGPFTENIHEDFAHIYSELRYGLQIMDQGESARAIRYWRDSYFCHWGHHASAAAWAIEWYHERMKHEEPPAPPMGSSTAS